MLSPNEACGVLLQVVRSVSKFSSTELSSLSFNALLSVSTIFRPDHLIADGMSGCLIQNLSQNYVNSAGMMKMVPLFDTSTSGTPYLIIACRKSFTVAAALETLCVMVFSGHLL